MLLSTRGLGWLLALAFGAVVACSSDDDDHPTPGAGGSHSAGRAGGAGKAGAGATGGTFAPDPCITGSEDATSEAGASGAAGEAGTGAVTPPVDECAAGGLADLPWLHTEGNQLQDSNGNAVVLRGVGIVDLGATSLEEGGIEAAIDRVTALDDGQSNSPGWATHAVRLMVAPADGDYQSPVPYDPEGDYYATILRPAVEYARVKGLYAIIDWHETDGTAAHPETTNAFWADMAPRFSEDSHVLFELFNEPTNGGDWFTTKYDMEVWYATVRKGAPNNVVLVGTPNWCQQIGDAADDPIEGTNIMYVSHMYPEGFALEFLQTQLLNAASKVPVFMTEWGFQEDPTNDPANAKTNGTVSSFAIPLKRILDEQRISWTAWSASAAWQPPMFNDDNTLRVGDGEMGGFVKDWLYEQRHDGVPLP
jgi:endoglucanase